MEWLEDNLLVQVLDKPAREVLVDLVLTCADELIRGIKWRLSGL